MELNVCSTKFLPSSRNVAPLHLFFSGRVTDNWRKNMQKLAYVLAAIATLAVAVPTVASAEGFGFRVGSDRDYYYRDRDYYGPRVEFRHDYGWHRGWYRDGDREVIIRRHHYWDD
jgi:hypothetical protein